MSTAKSTRNHATIKKWAEERGGHPSQVAGTGGMLRIDFEPRDESLEPIDWDDFFAIFDDRRLDFLYDPDKNSRFNKFVSDGE